MWLEDIANLKAKRRWQQKEVSNESKCTEKENTYKWLPFLITIALFVVMYVAGMIVFVDKGFAKPQMFLNLFVSNAGLLVVVVQ